MKALCDSWALLLSDPLPLAFRYDASGHLSEETRNAATSAARGIVLTVLVSFLVGFIYLISLTFSIQVGVTLHTTSSLLALLSAWSQRAAAIVRSPGWKAVSGHEQ